MANQSKKINTKSTITKTPVKKRRRRKSTKVSTFKKSIFIVLGVFFMISLVVFGYFLGQNDMKKSQSRISQTYQIYQTESKKKLLKDLSKIKTEKPEEKKSPYKKKVSSIEEQTSTKDVLQEKLEVEKLIEKKELPETCLSTHSFPPNILAAVIEEDTSADVFFLGIQPKSIQLSESLTEPVKEAARKIISCINSTG